MKKAALFLLSALVFSMNINALEMTAGQRQVTAPKTTAYQKAANIKANKVLKCQSKFMFYIPSHDDADEDGCVEKPVEGVKEVKICLENEYCEGTPLLCASLAPDSAATVPNSESNPIVFGSWSNSECGTSGSGWHNKHSSCHANRGNRYAKCSWVLFVE